MPAILPRCSVITASTSAISAMIPVSVARAMTARISLSTGMRCCLVTMLGSMSAMAASPFWNDKKYPDRPDNLTNRMFIGFFIVFVRDWEVLSGIVPDNLCRTVPEPYYGCVQATLLLCLTMTYLE